MAGENLDAFKSVANGAKEIDVNKKVKVGIIGTGWIVTQKSTKKVAWRLALAFASIFGGFTKNR